MNHSVKQINYNINNKMADFCTVRLFKTSKTTDVSIAQNNGFAMKEVIT